MQIIEISAAAPQNIAIGRCTENGVTQVKIDLSEITQKHPDLTRFEVLIKNPLGVTYPAVTERNENTLLWNVTAADTATAGKGFYEIAAYGENGEKKLAPYAAFVISGSLDGHRTETPPDPAKGYVEKVLSAAAAAEEAAKRAEEAAKKAESGGTVDPDSPGGEITPGAIKEAVADYLTENPPPAGPQGPEGPEGKQGPEGAPGENGKTPIKGTDYFTQTEIADIVAQAKAPIEPTWHNLPHNASAVTYPTDGSGCVYAKDGNVVSVQGSIKLITALNKDATVTIGTLPEGYRPKRSIADARMLGGALFRMAIDTAGAITITNFNTSALSNSYNLQINIEFIAGN